jgi:hypothetical protein
MIVVGGSHFGGDSLAYAKVATNILDHFCVSLSPPESAACLPHWGGNQLPGYPAFIALVWIVFGRSVEAVLIVQSLLFAAAAAHLATALARLGFAGPWPWLAALLLGISPSLVGWSRSLLTETMVAAVALWLLGELIMSWCEGRLRVVPTALALVVGIFLRYDFILLALPVAVAGFMIHRPGDALRRGLVISLIIALPLGAWTVRSIGQGLPPLPPIGFTIKGGALPKGMVAWLGTWVDDQYQLRSTLWMLNKLAYDRFTPPADIYADEAERGRIEAQLSLLRGHHLGQPPPPEIDGAFAAEAARRAARQPWQRWLFLPLRRTAAMWLSPYPSMGWPVEIDDSERSTILTDLHSRDAGALLDAMQRNVGAVATKIVVSLDRYLLILGALVLIAAAWRRRQRQVVFVAALIGAVFIARALFSGYVMLIETRYLVPVLAWFDVAMLVGVAAWRHRARPTPKVDPQ